MKKSTLIPNLKQHHLISILKGGDWMSLRSAMLLLFLIVSTLACGYIMKPPDGDSRPEGWMPLGLRDVGVNRLVLSDGWLYACAGKDGLYRIKHPANAGDEWEFLGLDSLDIERMTFPSGVTDILTSGSIILAGVWARKAPSEAFGIYRSTDDGKTWVRSDSGFVVDRNSTTSARVVQLVADPTDPQTVLAGCSGPYNVYQSSDFGQTWNLINSTTVGIFSTVAYNPGRDGEIWAGGGTAFPSPIMQKSSDGGSSWQSVIEAPQDTIIFDFVQDIAFDASDASTIFLCMRRQVLKTFDGGKSWADSALFDQTLTNLSLNPMNSAELMLLGQGTLFHSLDAGLTWPVLDTSPGVELTTTFTSDWGRRILYVGTHAGATSKGSVYILYF